MTERRFQAFSVLLAPLVCAALGGCFGSGSGSRGDGQGDAAPVTVEFPDGDPSVSAADGGPGFTGEGWTTAKPEPWGDPRAVKGGVLVCEIPNWPENLREYGTGSNLYLNSIVESLCYESLCDLHPTTLKTIPRLASHWKISEDNMVFTFRINPKAHWSDGKPVTADDVLATYRLIEDDSLQDFNNRADIVEKMEAPIVKSKYILEVHCKKKDWRNFMTICNMKLLPSHEIGSLTGEQYLDKFNFRYPPISGPYVVRPADIKTDESLTITRRSDYWNGEDPSNVGLYNFDKIHFVVIRESRLAFDKACKGEIDFYPVSTAAWWVEDVPKLEAVKKGHLVRQKIYNQSPASFQGLAFNMRRAPLDDVRVRLAIAHLFDRKTMVDKFAHGEYDLLKSYFPGGAHENRKNEMVTFDPKKAADLLNEAGWSERGGDGIRTKDGKRLTVSLSYETPFFEKYFTTLKDECKRAGVELNLNLLTPETHWKNSQEHKFELSSQAWTVSVFPSPRGEYHSSGADKSGSNNVTGIKSEVVDRLIEKYDAEFDRAKRDELLRELDGELFKLHPYALEWWLPCERILYWNKFGMPETVFTKYADWRDVFTTWWLDPAKDAALKAAKASGEPLGPIPPLEFRPWPLDEAKTAAR